MTTTVWVLTVLLLSPFGGPTVFEVERRFETYALCMEVRRNIMNAISPDEYIDSWCDGVEVVREIGLAV